MAKPLIKIYKADSIVSKEACSFIINAANEAIKKRGSFFIGLSGGSAAKYLCNELPQFETDWTKWKLFFCDERHVAFDDKECTFAYYRDNLIPKVKLTEHNFFPDNPSLSVEEAASKYEETIRTALHCDEGNIPKFDLLLLGMGPDGHTCSLFPDHSLLQEKEKLVAAISDSPKPPPQRITMTYPLINAARCAMFISCGEGKAEMVERVLESKEEPPLPACQVKLADGGPVYWFLDKAAARLLKSAHL